MTILIVVAVWILFNLGTTAIRTSLFDPPPFAWLQGVLTLAALVMTSLILTTKRREDEIATHREQLTLELNTLSEQKSAKIIKLLEELRRGSPHLRNRVDHEATALSQPVDPQCVLEAIKKAGINSLIEPENTVVS